jgi:hypothetical protein
MQFHSTPNTLSAEQIQSAQDKFSQLLLELATRKDNSQIGSGLGGDSLQLITLLGLQHHLTDSSSTIRISSADSMEWGYQFLTQSKMKDLRNQLTDVLTKDIVLSEANSKAASTMQKYLDEPSILTQIANENPNNYPALIRLVETGSYTHDPSLSMYEQLVLASLMAFKLANDLDHNDTKLLDIIGGAFSHFEVEIALLIGRSFLGIERIVKFNLDVHPVWSKVYTRINKAVG